MCGRYVLKASQSEIISAFSLLECADFDPRYNIAPLQSVPVVRQRHSGERVAQILRWGLIPSWSKDEAIANKLINARAETLAEKPSFRAAYKSRRCIVPASGFYEWKQLPNYKQPYFIRPAEGTLFGFAGLWERWNRPDGEPLDTFAIITTQAVDRMGELHERMPVILDAEDYGLWLDRETEPDLVRQLIAVPNAQALEIYPVARAVGNAKNEGASLIQEVEPGE
jgi:putative SOS response-associated peptidase YedK